MSETVIVAIIGLIGTGLGAFAGVVTSAKLTQYRIQQLEKKVEMHNNLIERMYKAEEELKVQGEKIKLANHRIDDLERKGAIE